MIHTNRQKEIEEFKAEKKEEERISKEKKDKVLEFLRDNNKVIKTYNRLLAEALVRRILYYVELRGWSFKVSPTDKGVIMELYSPEGRIFRNAFKSTGLEKYDLNAIDTYAIRAENTIDRYVPGREGESDNPDSS